MGCKRSYGGRGQEMAPTPTCPRRTTAHARVARDELPPAVPFCDLTPHQFHQLTGERKNSLPLTGQSFTARRIARDLHAAQLEYTRNGRGVQMETRFSFSLSAGADARHRSGLAARERQAVKVKWQAVKVKRQKLKGKSRSRAVSAHAWSRAGRAAGTGKRIACAKRIKRITDGRAHGEIVAGLWRDGGRPHAAAGTENGLLARNG